MLDIGPKTLALFGDAEDRQARSLERADGRVRVPEVRGGTFAIAKMLARAARRPSSAAATAQAQ